MKKNSNTKTAKARETAPEIPVWVSFTPEGPEYFLAMVEEGTAEHVDHVDLSRDEFIAAKQLIAEMRGYRKQTPGKAA